ncbi:MAG: hypothetical protein ACM3NS_06325 [Deltaproteobacteria bacterium]
MTARDLPPRIKAAVLLSAPFAAWLDIQIRQRIRAYRVHPRAAQPSYFQELERHWSFGHDLVVFLFVGILFMACIKVLAYFFYRD